MSLARLIYARVFKRKSLCGKPARRPLAAAGFTLIEILITLAILAALAAIAIPQYGRFIQRAREADVIAYLLLIKKGEDIYEFDTPGAAFTADFADLSATRAIPPGAAGPSRVIQTYTITLAVGVDADGTNMWTATATPLNPGAGDRWFYTDKSGIIRFAVGGAANATSQSI